jgi:hypothetical protein
MPKNKKQRGRPEGSKRPGSRPDLKTRTVPAPADSPAMKPFEMTLELDGDLEMSAAVSQLKKKAFLEAFRIFGTVYHAAQSAKISRRTVTNWKKSDPEFRVAFADAAEDATDMVEGSARVRANAGVKRSVYYKGKPIGTHLEYSDTLSIVLLKAYRPEKFREHYELSGPGGGPIEVTNPIQRIQAKLDEIARRSAALLPAGGPAPFDGEVDGDPVGAAAAGSKAGNPQRSRKG